MLVLGLRFSVQWRGAVEQLPSDHIRAWFSMACLWYFDTPSLDEYLGIYLRRPQDY